MTDKNILALDLGTKTGWAIFKKDAQGMLDMGEGYVVDRPITSGTLKLQPTSKINSHAERCIILESWLNSLPKNSTNFGVLDNPLNSLLYGNGDYIMSHKIDIVYFELVQQGVMARAAVELYGAFKTTIYKWAIENNIECVGVPVGTWKKAFQGKGNATKDMVKEKVKTIFPNFKGDDNEADAIGILHYALGLGEKLK